jgi:hypothetical protein
MSLSLPNLDDRRWADLVEEGRSLIPLYAPGWTDHNIHDPGVTLMELLAWIAEMDIYWLNRIPEEHKRKFLALAGIRPQPPAPARAVLGLTLKDTALPQPAPASLHFTGYDPFDQPVLFRTLEAATLVPGQLQAIQLWDGEQFHDLTGRWQRGETPALLGENPRPGAALYLGFSRALPQDAQVSLYFAFASPSAAEKERARIEQEMARQAQLCRPSDSLVTCAGEQPSTLTPGDLQPILHHSVRTAWEYLIGQQAWQGLDPASGQVLDKTRAFTLNGGVLIDMHRSTTPMAQASLGQAEADLYYLRCRFLSGAYDAPPQLHDIALNGIPVEQAVATQWVTRPIAAGATVTGAAPAIGDFASIRWQFNDQDEIIELHFGDAAWPKFRVLDYIPATAWKAGSLVIEAEWLGYGSGRPQQQCVLSDTAVQESSLRLFTLETDGWRAWRQRADFDASGRADAHFVPDATQGLITFGDGERGRVVPVGAPILATYRATLAQAGNLKADTITRLADTPHNQALLSAPDSIRDHLRTVTNPSPATGGAPAETVDEATGRALALMEEAQQAVTAADYEALALATPGVQLARVAVRANLHPGYPCFKAPGVITVIILPYLPADRPTPSQALRQAVTAYLTSRRVIGTRVVVVGPHYREIAVRASVQACPGTNTADLQQRIGAALDRFFHPLKGGPDNDGWPLGRDVYRSEVLQVIDETPGVDYVLSLELIAEGSEPQCGNICLGPIGLVAAGQHEIEVV